MLNARAMLRAAYDRTLALAGHRRAMAVLAVVAFVESSIFPIPPDALIIPMVLAERARAWRVAMVATVASVAGGFLGYAIGYALFEAVGRPVLAFYGLLDSFEAFRETYNAWGAWIVAGAGFTPFPYKVVTIASGATGLDLATFAVASAVSRGARFFLEAALLWYFGPAVRRFVERRLALVTSAFFVLLVAGFVVARYLLR